MDAPDLLACPRCSHPPHVLSRPICYQGVRSRRWMVVAEGTCDHADVFRAWNSADEPGPVADFWNNWAKEEAALRSAELGHTPERAAAFLAALQPARYSR